jgi:heme/copper-type cytochrome/quinol oxidase subunit 1
MTANANYINEDLALQWDEPAGWSRLITTGDHKIVGLRYIATAFLFFCFAGVEALLIRTQLAIPNNPLVDPEIYNQWFTMHGTLMIFFFATPMLFGFGNYFVPSAPCGRSTVTAASR